MFRPIAYELTRCPVCRSADTEQVAGPDEIRDEVEELWAFHERRLRPATPPEYLLDRLAFSQAPPWRVVRCQGCTLLFRNPRERPNELEAAYTVDAPSDAVLATLFENQRQSYRAQARRLTRALGRTGAGLEVGSYVGAFLAAAMDQGWYFEGLDISAESTSFARDLGFAVTTGTLETFVPSRRFDAVAIWNCFEQLPDPRVAVIRARALLGPGGVLAIRTPNGAFWLRLRKWLRGPGRSAARALLAHNNLLAMPYRHAFTTGALRHLLSDGGFRIEHTFGDVLVPVADEWTRRWAAIEERAIKSMLRILRRTTPPWLEVYARAE